jgi:predicted nuclease of predicted toxin-antitoxin system
MRFLANENYPFPSILLLREKGYDVKSIAENSHGISDDQVINIALEENRIILTFDRDYGELIFKYAPTRKPSVVYYRTKGRTPKEAGEILINLVLQDSFQFENLFTVIDDNHICQRKMN